MQSSPIQPKKKKIQKQSVEYYKQKNIIQKQSNNSVDDIYPVQIGDLSLYPQLKQYANELERSLIQHQNLLMLNRTKYNQMIQNFAAILDQKGFTSQYISQFLNKSSYHQNIQ